jgi:hypothetical protein
MSLENIKQKLREDDAAQVAEKEKKIPIAEAWALVAYADRINNGDYVKFPEFDPESGNVKRKPNRELISEQVAVMGFRSVTAEDKARGQILADHFQGLVFDALSGKANDFDQKIINLITAEQVQPHRDLAYMACLGARYRTDVVKEYRREQMFKVGHSSIHQGTLGQHLRLAVTVLAKFEGRAFPGSVVRATDGNNIYFWSSGKMVDMWPDTPEQFPVVGVVKAHGVDRDGYQETRLTRVKIVM